MTITAKYNGKCRMCGWPIEVGEKIEWVKGYGAHHIDCSDAEAKAEEFIENHDTHAAPVATNKMKVTVGSHEVGDTLNGSTITGFGKSWSQRIDDSEACVYGLQPGFDHYVDFQYAYFG